MQNEYERCDDCPQKVHCVRVGDLNPNRIGIWFSAVFFGVMCGVTLIERTVAIRPADVLEQLKQSEQNVSEQITALKELLRDHEKTNRQKHSRPDAAAERDTGRAGETKRPE